MAAIRAARLLPGEEPVDVLPVGVENDERDQQGEVEVGTRPLEERHHDRKPHGGAERAERNVPREVDHRREERRAMEAGVQPHQALDALVELGQLCDRLERFLVHPIQAVEALDHFLQLALDELERVGGVGRLADRLVGRRGRQAVGDVRLDRVVEEHDVLAHQRDVGAQRRERELLDVDAVDADASVVRQVEARHEARDRRLAAIRGADEGDRVAGRHLEADATQGVARPRRVAEADRFEGDVAGEPTGLARARVALRLLVDQGEDVLRGGEPSPGDFRNAGPITEAVNLGLTSSTQMREPATITSTPKSPRRANSEARQSPMRCSSAVRGAPRLMGPTDPAYRKPVAPAHRQPTSCRVTPSSVAVPRLPTKTTPQGVPRRRRW